MSAFKVQSASNTSVIASVTATFPTAPRAGNLLVAAVTANVGSLAISGWTNAKSIAVGIAGELDIFYKVSAGNETTVTATGTLATLMDLHIFEYDGIDNASPLDITASTADSGLGVTTLSSGTTAVLTQANELAFAAIATAGSNGGNVSWSNSYTAEITTTDLQTADLITNATTATSSTAVWNTSQRAAGAIVTFLAETGDTYGPKIPLKPRVPVINWGHPLTKGLIFNAPLFERGGSSPQEIVKKILGSFAGSTNPVWTQDLFGPGLSFNGVIGGPTLSHTLTSSQRSISKMTFMIIFTRRSAGANSAGTLFRNTDGTNSGFRLGTSTTAMNLIYDFSGQSGTTFTWPLPTNNVIHTQIVTYDDSNVANLPIAYMDGVPQTITTTAAPIGTPVYPDTTAIIGNINQTGNVMTRTWDGVIFLVGYWNRILSPSEVKQLYTNPWQIYDQPDILISK